MTVIENIIDIYIGMIISLLNILSYNSVRNKRIGLYVIMLYCLPIQFIFWLPDSDKIPLQI